MICIVATTASCTHVPADFGDVLISDICSPDTAYFQNVVFPIINSHCAQSGCHDPITQKEGINLSSWEAIYYGGTVKPGNANASEMYEVITENGDDRMPPDAPLNNEQIAIIQLWINQGALNNQCLDGDCDTTTVTYSGSIAPIMHNNCAGCHSGGSPSGGISLTSYSEVKAQAVSGALYGAISQQSDYTPMPPGTMLSDCQIDVIRIWIELNYPE
ncbi:MAG: c-type cytochrome domain-containing protein [Chitinophagales bacterium]